MKRKDMGIRYWVCLAVAGIALGLPTAAKAAGVGAAPTFPVPAGAPAEPPPIPALPAATATPPGADQISDPVTAGASCGGWYLQSNYGDQWPATTTWWEYKCTSEVAVYHDVMCTGVGGCDAFCPLCYWDTKDWSDYFYWDDTNAVFYGEAYSDSVVYDATGGFFSADWWDASAGQWYDTAPRDQLTVSKAGTGGGQVSSSPPGINCGTTCQASFDDGTSVTLTATPDASSVFTGWTGCTATGPNTSTVALNVDQTVTATFASSTPTLTISKQGLGSGTVSSSPAGISCGTSCQATFPIGSYVTLTATPDPGSVFTGFTGDCVATQSCQIAMNQNRSVTATFAPNQPPHASLTRSCTGLACSFDGRGSSDPDGTIQSYSWDFGDGTSATAATASHTYAQQGTYSVALTLTDNSGASTTTTTTVTLITLTARGYRQNGLEKANLNWNGPTATSYDVYRNSTKLATVPTTTYTDTIGTTPGSYHYKVCTTATTICSNQVTISFTQN
jgi:PKD repeat protein